MSLCLRLPSPRRGEGDSHTFATDDTLLKARMNLQEEPEPVGEIVARPMRVERDTKAEISNVETGIGTHFSMCVSRKGTHAVVGAQNGSLAVITLGSLYSGTPQIATAKIPTARSGTQVDIACSGSAETISAYETNAGYPTGKVAYVYSRSLSLKTKIERATPISAIAVSTDGSKVAIGCALRAKVSVYAISLVGQSLSIEFDVKELVFSSPLALCFSNSGAFLAMGGDMHKGCVWSTSSGSHSTEPLCVFERGGIINAIEFSKSDKWMALGSSNDRLLTLIDSATWEIAAEVRQADDVTAVSFSADELAIGCVTNQVLKVINRASLETTHEIGGSGDFQGVRAHAGWTPDGTLIVMGNKKIFAFDYKTQRECVMPPRFTPGFTPRQSVALSAYGQHVAYSANITPPGESKSSQTLVVETVGYARARPTFYYKLEGPLLKVAFSPDNTTLAALSATRLVLFQNDQNNGWKPRADAKLKDAAKTFVWSTNAKSLAVWLGTTLVSLSADNLAQQQERAHGSVFAYDLGRLGREFSGQGLGDEAKIKTLAGPTIVALGGKRVQEAKLSPDGQTLAAGGNGVLALIDCKVMEATETRKVRGWVMGLAWSSDSQTLAIGGHDKTVSVLNVLANVIVARCGMRDYWPTALAFSQNCGMLVDAGFASDKPQLTVYSCDGSQRPLIEPVDSAPMLRTDGPYDEKRREAILEMVSAYPGLALNALPADDVLLQPVAGGASRLADVLAHRTQRDLLEGLVNLLPALTVLPSAGRKHPTFSIALKQRDVRTLRALLVASVRAPLALRTALATSIIPALVQFRMSAAVTALLQQSDLEPSGSDIALGCKRDGSPLGQDDILELHPTHGGAGTGIWLDHDEDTSKLKTLLDARKGLESGEKGAIEKTSCLSGLLACARRALDAALAHTRGYQPLETRRATPLYARAYHAVASAIAAVPSDGLRRFLETNVLALAPEPDGASNVGSARFRGGVEVRAWRAPLPGLSSRACLEALCRIERNGTFDNALMRPTVEGLWSNHFFLDHLVTFLFHVIHVAALAAYIVQIAAGDRLYAAGDSDERSTLVTVAAAGVCVMSVPVAFFELRQLLGSQLNHGLFGGTLNYALSFWNVSDLLVASVPLYALALDATGGEIGTGHVHVKGLLAGSAVLLFMRTAQLLQGFERTGWLVMVLMANMRDMVGFIVLVSTSIFFFSLAFLMLFVDADSEQSGYAAAWHSLLNTFKMGVFSDFDGVHLDGDGTRNAAMTTALFVVFMVFVGVVALNALIAFLGDSYARVQDVQVETTLALKARLIVDSYTAAGPFAKRTEKRVAWTHVLRVVDQQDDGKNKPSEWAGQLSEIKRQIEASHKQLAADARERSERIETTLARVAAAVAVGSSRAAAAGPPRGIDA